MGVVSPDRPAWLERIIRNANDQAGFPFGQAREITIRRGIDGGLAWLAAAKHVDPRMAVPRPKGIVPDEPDVAIGRHGEGRLPAALPGFDHPICVVRGVVEELGEPLSTRGSGNAFALSRNQPGRQASNYEKDDQDPKQETNDANHSCV